MGGLGSAVGEAEGARPRLQDVAHELMHRARPKTVVQPDARAIKHAFRCRDRRLCHVDQLLSLAVAQKCTAGLCRNVSDDLAGCTGSGRRLCKQTCSASLQSVTVEARNALIARG